MLFSRPLSNVRSLFLRGVAFCYALAFLSLYPQLPGLYGSRGVLPARGRLPEGGPLADWAELLRRPADLLLSRGPEWAGWTLDEAMDAICLAGAFVGLVITVWPRLGTKVSFFLLWYLYQSLTSVGQTFLWFQWDTLLLEVGFLCLLVAPWWPPGGGSKNGPHGQSPWDQLNLFLVRWLLFRMMFASGCVKLTSQCPAWWGLTAMPVHYESQCLPTPLAWFAFQAPSYLHKLSVIGTYVIEIPLTFLFFAPTRLLRMVTFYAQVGLMLVIMATGNYNFFNLLYMVLCLSLLNDEDLRRARKPQIDTGSIGSTVSSTGAVTSAVEKFCSKASSYVNVFTAVLLLVGVGRYCFHIKTTTTAPNYLSLEPSLRFTKAEFGHFVRTASRFFVWVGTAGLGWAVFQSFFGAVNSSRSALGKTADVLNTLLHAFVALLLFSLTVPAFLGGLGDRQAETGTSVDLMLPKAVRAMADRHLGGLHVTSSFGLFRSMTGIGGRPEVILEGSLSASGDGPWKEFQFRYKPGNVSAMPLFVLPHQPRLDWQMWFAALGSYQHNPWIVSLMYRLLQNEPDVVKLLDPDHHPFRDRPPKLVRARLYHYHFTSYQDGGAGWWTRDFQREYFPPISLQSKEVVKYLEQMGVDVSRPRAAKTANWLLSTTRRIVEQFPHHHFVWSAALMVLPLAIFKDLVV